MINANSHIELAEIVTILSKKEAIKSIWIGPTYIFPEIKNGHNRATKITSANKEFLKENFLYTYVEIELKQPCYAIIEQNKAVSICCSARQTSRAAEASLYILNEFRGRGAMGQSFLLLGPRIYKTKVELLYTAHPGITVHHKMLRKN